MKESNWKDRLNVVYSTNPDYRYESGQEAEVETLPREKQNLRVNIERKGRGGKTVTVVSGFTGSEEELKVLGKLLKTRCGVGGSEKEGEILLQGEMKGKVVEILQKEGYVKTK